jgi:hypothetical protein
LFVLVVYLITNVGSVTECSIPAYSFGFLDIAFIIGSVELIKTNQICTFWIYEGLPKSISSVFMTTNTKTNTCILGNISTLGIRVMVFNATFNTILAIAWQWILLVEEIRVHGEDHRPSVSHWQTLSHNVVSSTPRHISELLNSDLYIIFQIVKNYRMSLVADSEPVGCTYKLFSTPDRVFSLNLDPRKQSSSTAR